MNKNRSPRAAHSPSSSFRKAVKVAGNAVPVSGKEMKTEMSRLRHCVGDDVHVKRQMALLKKGCEKRA